MTDPTTQPAPTLEETQAELANLDPTTANILRRRLGLALVEPEPSREPAPETSARAAIREKLADILPTAPAIDSEAMQRLDAEIAAKARAEQEAKARAEQEAAKVAKAQSEAVTAALEPLKARARILSPVKRRVIESSVKIRGEVPDEVIYQHSVFCQTVLPYRDPGPDVQIWEREQGNARLRVTAGVVDDKRKRQFVPVGLPYGAAPRLILAHLNTEALQTHNRVIDVDGSLTAFIRRVTCRPPCGRDFSRFREQLLRLSGCNITIAYDLGERAIQVNSHIVTAFDLWEEDHEGERCLTPKTIALSLDYFESLLAHAVPLDDRAVAALTHSVMALDVYMWLAQRLHRMDPHRPQFITWKALYTQFGQGYDRIRDFRRDFKTVLNQVLTQYPDARVKTDKGGIWLFNSPPPVPSRRVILLPPTEG